MKRAGHDLFSAPHRLMLLAALVLLRLTEFSAPATRNALTPYSVRIWQTDDGLPQNSVHAIAQTADGFLWVGTHEGLARFDGVRFTVIDDKTAPELKRG